MDNQSSRSTQCDLSGLYRKILSSRHSSHSHLHTAHHTLQCTIKPSQPGSYFTRCLSWTPSLIPCVKAASDDNSTDSAVLDKVGPLDNIKIAPIQRPPNLVTDVEVQEYINNETAMDRLHSMWSWGQKPGSLSWELDQLFFYVKLTAYGGFIMGTFFGSRNASDEFQRKNKHTKWPTKFTASRRYLDATFLGGVKYGTFMGLRTGAFTALYMGTVMSVSVYRNKTSVWEHLAAGGLAGSIMRMNMGLKGMFAGGLLGTILGSCAGILLTGAAWALGETQDVLHFRKVKEMLQDDREYQVPTKEEIISKITTS